MEIKTIISYEMDQNCYLIKENGFGILIDPGIDTFKIILFSSKKQGKIMDEASIIIKPTIDIMILFCSPCLISLIERRVSFNLPFIAPCNKKAVNTHIYAIVITSAGFANPKGKII